MEGADVTSGGVATSASVEDELDGPGTLRELGPESVLALPPEEQYLVATGRTYFRVRHSR